MKNNYFPAKQKKNSEKSGNVYIFLISIIWLNSGS